MEKIYKIMAVFGLLMLAITYSMYARGQRFREYYFSKRMPLPIPEGPVNGWLSARVAAEGYGAEAEDREDQLAFHSGARGERQLYISDWRTGDPVAVVALEESPDAIIFDPATKLIYSYSSEGALTIIRQSNQSTYRVVQRLLLPKDGDLLGLDTQTGKVYLSAGGSVSVYSNE